MNEKSFVKSSYSFTLMFPIDVIVEEKKGFSI